MTHVYIEKRHTLQNVWICSQRNAQMTGDNTEWKRTPLDNGQSLQLKAILASLWIMFPSTVSSLLSHCYKVVMTFC